jgi:hypothetical protein
MPLVQGAHSRNKAGFDTILLLTGKKIPEGSYLFNNHHNQAFWYLKPLFRAILRIN